MDKNHAAALEASSAGALIKQLWALGCKTAVSGDRLVVTPGGERIPPRLLMELRQHKSAVVELLKQRAAPPASPNSAPSAPPVSGAHGLNRKPSKSADLDNRAPPLSALTSTPPSSPSSAPPAVSAMTSRTPIASGRGADGLNARPHLTRQYSKIARFTVAHSSRSRCRLLGNDVDAGEITEEQRADAERRLEACRTKARLAAIRSTATTQQAAVD